MKTIQFNVLALFLGGLALLPPAVARADELVVMPYACHVAADGPQLRPADNIGHRIVGRRESTVFTACSPARPDQCRRWTIHRFDMECGGRVVPWTDVVAAASGVRRAWVGRDGVFRIRMPAWWALAPDDPCLPASAPYERLRPGVVRRLCADRAASGETLALSTVAFPPGFAPTFGMDAIFVPAPPPAGGRTVSAEPPRGPVATVDRPPQAQPKGATGEPKIVNAEPPREKKTAPTTTATLQAGPTLARPVDRGPEPGFAKTAPDTSSETASQGPDTGGANPVVPRVLNAPSQEAPAIGRADAAPVPASEGPAIPLETPPVRVETAGWSDDPTFPIAIAAGGGLAVLGAAVAFLVMAGRRFEKSAPPERDLHAIRMEAAPAGQNRSLTLHRPRAESVPMRPPMPQGRAAVLADPAALPATVEDAMGILGLGVGPGADLVAIKKMVDALRFSWHPDRAHDAQDRQAREQRIRQINAAWEILSGSVQGGRPA